MALSYHFPSNTPAQSARRRQLLDAYGQFAQLSAIILPLFLFLIFFAAQFLFKTLSKRRGNGYSILQPSPSPTPRKKLRESPRVAHFRASEVVAVLSEEGERKSIRRKPSSLIARLWTHFRWAVNGPVVPGWGTGRQWSVAALWTAWLLLLIVKDTGDDYLHLTRRFGIVAASQLPLHYLLALKSWSPIQYLTRLSHEELNPYHRLLGRILTFSLLAHGILYLNFYVQLSILLKRLGSPEVILGLCALTTLLVLNSTALARVRTWSYRFFFASHVLLSIIILPLLYFHVSHARVYVLEAAAIYILLLIQRNVSSTPVLATISPIPSSPLISIRIPLTPRLTRRNYHPGQHIYLSLPATSTSPWNKLRHHPFTIATLPSPSTTEIELVIRPIRGTTQLLSSLAQQPQPVPKSRLLIEGPYGASRHFPDFLRTYDRILLVAGGVGATFTLPIYHHLLQQQQQQQHEKPHSPNPKTNPKLRFIWSVRSLADAAWALQHLQLDEELSGDDNSNSNSNSTSHHHPPYQQDPPSPSSSSSYDIYISSTSHPHIQTQTQTQTQDLELQPRPSIPIPITTSPSIPIPHHRIHTGRPNLRAIVDEIFTDADVHIEAEPLTEYNNDEDDSAEEEESNGNRNDNGNGKVAILVCGPVGMGVELRREVGRWVGRGRDGGSGKWEVFWHDEEFGW